ncbi:MAG: protein translocase subunit SecD [Cyanobacteria bacterium HKST-UBA03]|nr:protein translocase subunit SecD [Cyanobacteria bacterium HKST-UBA03]
MRLIDNRIMLAVILALIVTSVWVLIDKPFKLGLDLSGGVRFLLQAEPNDEVPKITPEVMDTLHLVVDRRVNPTGTEENLVQKVGDNRVLIEIPGAKDPEQAKAIIGKTGELSFRAYDPETDTYVKTGLGGKDLVSASAAIDNTPTRPGNWKILLAFNGEGGKKFFDITRELAKRQGNLGIFFDGELQSAPSVHAAISGGKAEITGSFTQEQAQGIVDILRAGALPVDVNIIEESTVGPLLGKASLEKSMTAGMIGLLMVLVFMIIYYRLPGMFANLALVVYAVLLLAAIKLTPTALSLSGIAGVILSIGMAVDANILIFERTREELKLGRTVEMAVKLGFDRAFPSIFDSNMTTIITCMILYILGTGLVKGFAFSLALGVAVSFFTALAVTRTFMMMFMPIRGPLKNPALFGLSKEDIPATA